MIPADFDRAIALLRAGDLVAFPTETVYGLGADASSSSAVAKIFATKQRPADHPLIVHLGENPRLELWAREIPRAAQALADAYWPGPLTLILKRQRRVPDAVTGGQDTVGLRVPGHPVALELLARFASGIAAPSANRYGRISPTTAAHVRAEFGETVPLILDGGPCQVGIESTIVDLSRGRPVVLRPGAITAAQIGEVLSLDPAQFGETDHDAPRVSGSLPGHYAPRTPLLLVTADKIAAEVAARIAQGLHISVLARTASPVRHHLVNWQRTMSEPDAYAHDLYAHLREFDAHARDLIVVEAPPQEPQWLAINDRLDRAARGSGEEEP